MKQPELDEKGRPLYRNRNRWPKKKPPVEFILDWYDAWLRCTDIKQVCHALEINDRMSIWDSYPDLVYARELACERRDSLGTFSGYIFKHLSKEAREIWQRCEFYTESTTSSEAIEKILHGQPKRIRQELFLHALVRSNFDVSEALHKVHIDRTTYDNWTRDYDFRQLVEEIQWHKKNFFEHALVDLVEQRHPGAVLFVNRTVNADRGYGEKVSIEHRNGNGVRLDELDLDIETKRKILDAMRLRKPAIAPIQERKAIDVKSVVDVEPIGE